MNASLFGREAELDATRAAVQRALDGRGALVLITGEAGIGKSRLLAEAEKLAQARGCQVAWGRAWEAGGAPAFWPWMQVFRALGLPWTSPDNVQSTDARFALFDRVAETLAVRATAHPLALLFDDIHAADDASLALLLFVSRRLAREGVLMVVAARDAEVSDRAGFLALAREATCLTPKRLDLEHLLVWAGPTLGAEIHARSEGLPLFAEELLRDRTGGGRTHRLSAVIEQSIGRLPAETRAVLGVGAVVGRSFHLDDLDAADRDRAAAALNIAADAGVLRREVDVYTFGHVLLRDHLYESLEPTKRDEAHWRFGQRLLERGETALAAHHLLRGVRAGDVAVAAHVALNAAREEFRALAFEAAAGRAQQALEAVPPAGIALELQLVRAEALQACGDTANGRAAAEAAHQLAAAEKDPDGMSRAALAYGRVWFTARIDPTLVRLLETALAAGPPPRQKPRVLARLAAAYAPPRGAEQAARMVTQAEEAIRIARLVGEPEVLLDTMRYAASALGYVVPTDERRKFTDELLTVAVALDRSDVVLEIAGIAAVLRAIAGQDAADALDHLDRGCTKFGRPHWWRRSAAAGTDAILRGDVDQASRCADELLEFSAEQEVTGIRLAHFALRMGIAAVTEDLGPVRPFLHAALGEPAFGVFRPWLYVADGRPQEAAAAARALLTSPGGFPQHILAATAVTLLADPELARLAMARLEEHIDKNEFFCGPGGALCAGPTSKVYGDLAAIAGEHDAARQAWTRALAVAERANYIPMIRRLRGVLGQPAPAVTVAVPTVALVRDGSLWRLDVDGVTLGHLPNVKGAGFLAKMLDHPNQPMHVLDLVGQTHASSNAGPMIDEAAAEAYRGRVRELREELSQAEAWADLGHASRIREELESIRDELARAFGLGGRARNAASDVERARINVQRRVKDAVDRVEALNPAVATMLRRSVRTGIICTYER